MFAFALILASALQIARAGCGVDELHAASEQADTAFSEMNAEAFDEASKRLGEALSCQDSAVGPADCALLHLNHGLQAFLNGDAPTAILAFRAALDADPEVQLPADVAPPGHPLQELFSTAQDWRAERATRALEPPAEGVLLIDGVSTQVAPADRPFVFQRVLPDGASAQAAYVLPDEPPPSYDTLPPLAAVTPRLEEPLVVERPRKKRGWMVGVGVALGTVSLGALGGSFVADANYQEARELGEEQRILRNYHLNRGLWIGGVAGALAGTGLVVIGRL